MYIKWSHHLKRYNVFGITNLSNWSGPLSVEIVASTEKSKAKAPRLPAPSAQVTLGFRFRFRGKYIYHPVLTQREKRLIYTVPYFPYWDRLFPYIGIQRPYTGIYRIVFRRFSCSVNPIRPGDIFIPPASFFLYLKKYKWYELHFLGFFQTFIFLTK